MRGYQDSDDAERSEGGGEEEDEEGQGEEKEQEGEEEGKEEYKENREDEEEEEEDRAGHQNCQIGKVLTIVKTISVDDDRRNQIARRTRFQVSQVVRQCRKHE